MTRNRRGAHVLALCAALPAAGALSAAAEPPAFVYAIDTIAVFEALTVPETFRTDLARAGKYLAPAREDPDLLPVVFQDVSRYPRHIEFMAREFPDRFPALTPEEYVRLVERRATRSYWVGMLLEIHPADGGTHYGITIFTDPARTEELPEEDEVAALIARIEAAFHLGPVLYVPDREDARQRARSWPNPAFGIYDLEPDDALTYEAYSLGTAYGRVRLMTTAEAERASVTGMLSWQDIVVVDGVPTFLESVVAGIVTGARQGELSHLNVRAAPRGTPNVFVRNARDVFAPFSDALVRIEFGAVTYQDPVPVSEAEARAWWTANRPRLDPPPPPDLAWPEVLPLELMTGDTDALRARYGGKAANLAVLFRCIDPRVQVPGFAIPFHWYDAFMARNVILDRRQSPPRAVSYAAYVQSLLDDTRFRSDPPYRAALLTALVRAMRDNAVIDPDLVALLAARIETVFGSHLRMVRFRSSSNMEDRLEFNGAGLYDSTSACAADSLAGGSGGPSFCDPLQSSRRRIERALRRVWSSLWNVRAFEERDYYQLPHQDAAMAVLVTPAYPDEAANGVAFTGNPLDPLDRRFLVNVQAGDASVVNPDPAVVPEKSLLEITDGRVVGITRARPSSIVPPGTNVLSDAQLEELGAACLSAMDCFPVNTGDYDPARVILDLEFKFLQNGDLVIKQIRPYLIPAAAVGPTPEFAIEVPPGTAVCGVYKLDRSLDQEEAVLSYAQLAGGTHILRTDRTQFDGALIERLWIGGPNREAVALEPGRFSLAVQRDGAGQARYDYTFRQPFSVEGQRYDVEIARLRFGAGGAAGRIVFDEQYLGSIAATEGLLPGLAMTARTDPPSYLSEVVFGSVTYAVLPLFQVETGTADIAITLRYRRLTLLGAYGPANLTHARVVIHGEERVVDAYWHLVYRARMHNTQQHFRVRLAPPAGDVHAVDVLEPFEDVLPPRIVLRGAGMEILDAFEPPGYVETPLHDPAPVAFVRGDADGNGFTNISDAVLVIRYVVGADPPAPCVKALDVNDDGAVGIDDAVHLLGHLFLGTGPLAPPAAACGYDPTPDDLPCAVYPRCGN